MYSMSFSAIAIPLLSLGRWRFLVHFSSDFDEWRLAELDLDLEDVRLSPDDFLDERLFDLLDDRSEDLDGDRREAFLPPERPRVWFCFRFSEYKIEQNTRSDTPTVSHIPNSLSDKK